jgi:hypothetical protein
MFLGEVLRKKKFLEEQIAEMESKLIELATEETQGRANQAAERLFELLDAYQSHLITLNKYNNVTTILVGETEVNLANTIILSDVVKSKIDKLTTLIKQPGSKLDTMDLIRQRATLLEEFYLYDTALQEALWSIEID